MMGGTGAPTDLQNALDILKGLSDPAAAVKTLTEQLAAAEALIDQRNKLATAKVEYDKAAQAAIDAQDALAVRQEDLDAREKDLMSREVAITADREALIAERASVSKQYTDHQQQMKDDRDESAASEAIIDGRLKQRENALIAREKDAKDKTTAAENLAANAQAAKDRAEAIIADYQSRIDAIRKAAGL